MVANDYPTVQNGGPVDANLWFNPVAQDLTALKAATNVLTAFSTFDLNFASQPTFTDAGGMVETVVGGAWYDIEWYFEITGASGVGLKYGFTMPTGSVLSARYDGWNDATGVWAAAYLSGTTTWQTPIGYGFNGTSATSAAVGRGTLITTTGGPLQLQIAQRVNSATTISVLKASWFSARKIV